MAKNNQPPIQPVPREAIADVRGEADFVELLRRELSWPIPEHLERLDDVVIPLDLQQDFGFPAGEDRIHVSRLLNLSGDQPWGIVLLEFKTKRPYMTHLRRLLRVLGSRRTLRQGDPIWNRSDLLFICTRDWTEYQFVHFAGERPESAVISSFGWAGPDDPFLHTLCKHNLPLLRLPEPDAAGDIDPEKWRSQWSDAFNIKPVTDEFYRTLKEVFDAVQAGVKGLKGENRRFFSELLVNRLIFLKFVERKGWLDGDSDYLYNRFKQHGRKNYWRNFLFYFFFEGLNTEPEQRTAKVKDLLGDVPFLNAELFAKSDKWDDEAVEVVNNVFDLLFDKLLNPYNFTVCETSPLDVEVAFNQDLLGYGYEELIADQHGQGAYYTHPTEVNLMCRESLRAYLEARCPDVDREIIGKLVYGELNTSSSIAPPPYHDLLKLYQALHEVTVVDPALGSGTFPVAMMKHLYLCMATLGKMLKGVAAFQAKVKTQELTDPTDAFRLKLHIIEKSLYGCDIDYFAVQIAKLRFWIELMVNCEEPSALPNFDFKLVVGDALVSVVGTTSDGKPIALENILGHPTKGQLSLDKLYVDQYAELKRKYFAVKDSSEREKLRAQIEEAKERLLINLGVSIPKSRRTDKHVLWQIDFAEIFSGENPGFDIAIANPPYLRHELINASFVSSGLMVDFEFLRLKYPKVYDVEVSGQSDLYVFFFIRSIALLKREFGVLCFICSNSWLDVDYGGALQAHMASATNIRAIVDNKYRRSFATADINTAITLFVTCANNRQAQESTANFISYRAPFDQGGALPLALHAEKIAVTEGVICRRFVIPQRLLQNEAVAEPSRNAKWGARFLRSPNIYFRLIDRIGKEVLRLDEIAEVGTYLNTGGADGFFFLKIVEWGKNTAIVETSDGSKKFNIPLKYLRLIIRSPRECSQILVTRDHIDWCLFVCDQSIIGLPDEVKRLIQWGEVEGFNERSGCRIRTPWYRLPDQAKKGAPILIGRNHDQTHIVYFNPDNYVSNRFYRIVPHQGYSIESLAAYLNSTLGWLQKELLGRTNLGQGALDTQGTDLSRILVPNRLVSNIISKYAMNAFLNIGKRKALPVKEELGQGDRIELDRLILDAMGWLEYRSELYEAVYDLVAARLQRARSI